MRQFYKVFSNPKWSPLVTKLSWSHYIELLPIKDNKKLMYYLNISLEQHLSKRDLREKIKNKEYERLPKKIKVKLIKDKKGTQDKNIGIIICKQDNKYVIKYCSDKRIIAREYKLV